MTFKPLHNTQQALGSIQEEMNHLFERAWHNGFSTPPLDGQSWGPAIDVYEYDDRYIAHVEVPGVDGGAEHLRGAARSCRGGLERRGDVFARAGGCGEQHARDRRDLRGRGPIRQRERSPKRPLFQTCAKPITSTADVLSPVTESEWCMIVTSS